LEDFPLLKKYGAEIAALPYIQSILTVETLCVWMVLDLEAAVAAYPYS
jgi:hypothetical protein